jgi:NAD(P)-dependent dehydrogenase (short-subunit alcohol dehydrogenase family)
MPYTLVTGGSKRLGKEICLQLAKAGRDILVHYNKSLKEAETLCMELRAHGVQAEAIQGEFDTLLSTEDFAQRCPEIDGLVNNVGNFLVGSAAETSPQELQKLFQTTVNAPLALIQAFLPSLKRNRGSIINLGMVGCHTPSANLHASFYNLCKTALWGLTLSLAKELAPAGVRVNMVSPGYLEHSRDLPKDLDHIPMKRVGELFEVARVVAFLMHPQSSYITGQNIEVAGGVKL